MQSKTVIMSLTMQRRNKRHASRRRETVNGRDFERNGEDVYCASQDVLRKVCAGYPVDTCLAIWMYETTDVVDSRDLRSLRPAARFTFRPLISNAPETYTIWDDEADDWLSVSGDQKFMFNATIA